MSKRQFTAYEINQLTKHGLDPFTLADIINPDIPIEYITCFSEFRGRDFEVDPAVLIPRIETEEIIDIALKHVATNRSVVYCDIGTGSGAIGISFGMELAKRNLTYYGILSDISSKALSIAKDNLESLMPQDKCIKLIKSDLMNDYPEIEFDVIFANLPYIPSTRIKQLDSSVKDYEPIGALDGGKDGLKYIRKLLEQAPKFLKSKGVIILEVDDTHTDTSEFAGHWNIDVQLDINQKNRFWIIGKN